MFSAVLLLGCTAPAATPLPFSREQAVAQAAQDARLSAPEAGIRQARIDSVTAELNTLDEADRRMGGQRGPARREIPPSRVGKGAGGLGRSSGQATRHQP